MDFGRDRMRVNADGDRLSSLPNDIIHKILSLISLKQAIQTSTLSSRWRFMWTSLPYLNFLSGYSWKLPKFTAFVDHVLSLRDNQMEVFSVHFSSDKLVGQEFVKRVLDYAFSHNVQQLSITCSLESDNRFPLSLFRSQSLKHLTLGGTYIYEHCMMGTSTCELPALTTLHLDRMTLSDNCIALFSKCTNLRNLILSHFNMMAWNAINICLPQLSNLTLEDGYSSTVVNVVAPQLKNLTIITCRGEHLISAPDLTSLVFKCHRPSLRITDGFPSLESVDLCIYDLEKADAHEIVSLLQQLHRVNYLTLNMEIVKVISSSVELISHRPSPFVNLKTLKIYPLRTYPGKQAQTMLTEVNKYFLDSSPCATFTMVSCEEVDAGIYAEIVRELIANLWVVLEEEKVEAHTALMESHNVKHAQEESQVKDRMAKPGTEREFHIWERVAQINRFSEDVIVQIEHGKEKARYILGKLREIENLLRALPASKTAHMQACFSRQCVEADTIVSMIFNRMKIQCDKKLSGFNGYFPELATTSQSSF